MLPVFFFAFYLNTLGGKEAPTFLDRCFFLALHHFVGLHVGVWRPGSGSSHCLRPAHETRTDGWPAADGMPCKWDPLNSHYSDKTPTHLLSVEKLSSHLVMRPNDFAILFFFLSEPLGVQASSAKCSVRTGIHTGEWNQKIDIKTGLAWSAQKQEQVSKEQEQLLWCCWRQ